MAKQAPARKAVIGADRRFIAIGSSMKMPSLRRSSGTSAGPRPTESAGSRGRHGWPFSSPRCTRLLLAPNSALHSSVLPAPASPAIPRISPSAGAAKYPAATPHHADRQPATAPLRPCGARRREDIAQLVAQHLFDDLFAAQRPHRAALNQPPVAQHRQGVADRLQLMDTMRNKHHPDP